MKEPLTPEDYMDIYLENFLGLNLNKPKDYKEVENSILEEIKKFRKEASNSDI